ncbi:MAG: hypothetical protein FWG91_03135 [Lachnospiraceae bacterium]|nr:hypothetical protein [Lachnospiraceae bacterium]
MKMDMTALTGYNTRKDYSMLLNNLPSRSGAAGAAANLNFLSDYASIKNGSYGKLMSAYYGPDRDRVSGIANNSLSTSRDSSRQLRDIQNNAEALKKSADSLLSTGSQSVFNETNITATDDKGVTTTSRGFDTNAIFKAVSTFANDYNNLLDKGRESNASGIASRVNSLTSMTSLNRNLLGQVGIRLDGDGKMSVDEEAFKKANMSTVQSLFQGTGSYAFQVSAQASLIDFTAANEAARSNTYNASGSFTNNFSSGNIFGSFF